MIRERVATVVALASILLVACSSQTQAPPPAPQPETTLGEIQVNTVQEFKFPGGTFKDGKVRVDPGYKVEPGAEKNVVMLRPASGNGTTFSCFCVLEGGDCAAISTPLPDGDIDLACVSFNCSSGKPPFCFQEIDCPDQGLKIRLAVSGMKAPEK